MSRIKELDEIHAVLSDPMRQQGLVMLYRSSQSAHTHNGKIAQEIGCAREGDLKAVLHECIGDNFKCDVVNNKDNGADCMLGSKLISIKHVSAPVGKSFPKAKWTSDETKANEFVSQMLTLSPENYTHMIMVNIDVTGKRAKNTITITGISAEQMMFSVEMLQEEAFKTSVGTNSRGVEYSKKMVEELMRRKYFQIVIPDVVLDGGANPHERRCAELRALYTLL